MDLIGHGLEKYGPEDVLASSLSCEWAGVGAELRHHPAAELPAFNLLQTEIGVATRSHPNAVVSRRGNGEAQTTRVARGTVWTCPAGVREEEIRLDEWHECFHIYLPTSRFVELSEARGGSNVDAAHILYLSDVQDALIRQIAFTMLEELREPTSAGRVLVESLAISLVARLAQTCTPEAHGQLRSLYLSHSLDDDRYRRVLDYIYSHLEQEISVDDLAAVACLSPFHFIRLFRNRTGVPPSRFVGNLRLERAKELLAKRQMTIVEIALACCFSSQSSFTRAFRRATGESPGRFRQRG